MENDVLVSIERDRPLRPTDEIDDDRGALRSLDLEGEKISLLFEWIGAVETGIVRYVMKRACDFGIADGNVRLKFRYGLPEKISFSRLRLNGEA